MTACRYDNCPSPAVHEMVPLNPNMVPPRPHAPVNPACEFHARRQVDPHLTQRPAGWLSARIAKAASDFDATPDWMKSPVPSPYFADVSLPPAGGGVR